MTRATSRFWLSIGLWLTIQFITSATMIERVTPALVHDTMGLGVARVTGYVAAVAALFVGAGALVAFVLLTFAILRWFEPGHGLDAVIDATTRAIQFLAAFGLVMVICFMLIDGSSISEATMRGAESIGAAITAPEPWRAFWVARFLGIAVAGAIAADTLRRRAGCGWINATLSVATSAAVVAGIGHLITLATDVT